jgi:phosphate-selective porin
MDILGLKADVLSLRDRLNQMEQRLWTLETGDITECLRLLQETSRQYSQFLEQAACQAAINQEQLEINDILLAELKKLQQAVLYLAKTSGHGAELKQLLSSMTDNDASTWQWPTNLPVM